MENPNYAMTVFYDDFKSNWRNNWNANTNHEVFNSPNYGNILIWVDSTATIHQDTNLGNLYLTAIEYDGYTSYDWSTPPNLITADNISGAVRSKDRFLYGVFECNATFGYKHGSFPAFWLFFDSICGYDYGSEIDIVELKYEAPNPGLDNHAFYYPCGSGGFVSVPNSWKDNKFNWSSGNPHTFKCIWTPTKTEWYVDNTKLHTINKTGNNHYPNKTMDIRLSQQLWPYNGDMDNIDVPVTSTFHWVSAKEFFLAPEITCPAIVCTSVTTVMDLDSRADSITWKLTPTNLFSGNKTGTGKNATITRASGASGEGKITYTFKMPSSEIFTVEKIFTVGVPNPDYIDFVNIGPNYPGSMVLCNNMPNDGKVRWNGAGDILEYSWSVYDNGGNTWQVVQHPMDDYPEIPMKDVQFSKPYGSVYGWVNVKVKARNQCSGWGEYKLPALQFSTSSCYTYYLSIAPNPASDETVLTIENQSEVQSIDENAEWELEVYDSFQSLKDKKTKLRGNEQKIQTAGWKEGVYFVRVKYKDKILTGQLVVKQ